MKRSVPLWTALLLAGCGFPYTPRALPPLSTPDPAAAAPAPPYTPPRQTELAAAAMATSNRVALDQLLIQQLP